MIQLAVYFEPPDDFIARLGNISDKIKINVCTKRDNLKSCLPETEILVTLFSWPDAETIKLAPRLKWIQALTAGVDLLPLSEIREQGIVLTCGRGIHKIYIAEYAIAGRQPPVAPGQRDSHAAYCRRLTPISRSGAGYPQP